MATVTIKYDQFDTNRFLKCSREISEWMKENSILGWYSSVCDSQMVFVYDEDATAFRLKFGEYCK